MRTVDQFQAFTERFMLHPRRGIIAEDTCCLGIAGEVGEVAALLLDDVHARTKLNKELGDVLWYVTALAWHYDTTIAVLLDDAAAARGAAVAPDDAALRMASAFGGAIDHVKKVTWHDAEPDQGLVLRSLRDGLVALLALAKAYGLTIDDIMRANIAKLRARHGDSFSGGAGDRTKPEAA